MPEQSFFPEANEIRCVSCGQLKPPTAFGSDPRKRNGHKSACRKCETQRLRNFAARRRANPPSDAGERRCAACKETKPLTDFARDLLKSLGRDNRCRQCRSIATKEMRARLKEDPEWRHKARRSHRRYNLKRSYGMTHEEYDALHAAQNGLCAICGKPETARRHGHTGQTRDLSVDHDHDTGELRSLLCSACNHLLGNAGDSIPILEAAIRYLRRYGK